MRSQVEVAVVGAPADRTGGFFPNHETEGCRLRSGGGQAMPGVVFKAPGDGQMCVWRGQRVADVARGARLFVLCAFSPFFPHDKAP